MILLLDEKIQEAADKYAPVFEIDGNLLSKVEILQRQHARLRAVAKAQLREVVDELTPILTSAASIGKKLIQVVDLVAEMQSLLSEVKNV